MYNPKYQEYFSKISKIKEMPKSKHNKMFCFPKIIVIKITLEIKVFNLKVVLTQLSNKSHLKLILKNTIVDNNFLKFDKININFIKLLKILFDNNCKQNFNFI